MILKKILLIIALIFLMALNVFAQTGSYTSHDIFYLPLYGAYGTDEYDQYNTYMEIADQLIWDNKTAIEAIEADYLVAADLTGYYTKLEIDAFGYITDAEAVTAIKADEDWNATEWDLAYGWGDHALAGYLTSVALNDLSDVDTTGVADGKIIKYDIATSKWIIADDDDTGTTYTAGTGLDLTGTVFSLDASAFDLSDFPADPDADRYLFWNDTTGAITWAEGSGSGVTTFVGLTDTPLNYTGYAGYFPKVNAGATALEFAELTEADISDFGTYLTDITSESFADLSDIPAHPGVAAKMLETTVDGYQYIDTPSGGAGATAFTGLTDTPANYTDAAGKFVKVNSTPDGLEYASITESDITDLGTYLTDITGESLLDLTDTPAAFSSGKFAKSGAAAITFESITESDISDFGSYLENVVEDTTPELGGELDAGANSIGFTLQTVAEADGTTTIDWKLGNHCKVTLGAQAETFTFTAPTNPCSLTLIIVQDATGGRDITWPATVKWLGTEATWTDGGAGKGIVVGFLYDGTNYWGQATPWES